MPVLAWCIIWPDLFIVEQGRSLSGEKYDKINERVAMQAGEVVFDGVCQGDEGRK